MTSDTKILANRRNALASTGPRTPQGKARSAINATKHGLTARKYFVAEGESAAEFEKLRQNVLAQFPPRDELEKHAVERLIELLWKWKRAQRIETAALSGTAHVGNPTLGRVLTLRTNLPISARLKQQLAEVDIIALTERLDRYTVGIWREIYRLLDRLESDRMLEAEPSRKQNLADIIDVPSERLDERG